MSADRELLEIATRLSKQFALGESTDIAEPISKLIKAVSQIDKTFSGSWIGYHANVYYEGFKPPPAGVHFNAEWGLGGPGNPFGSGNSKDWREYTPEEVKNTIYQLAGNPDLEPIRELVMASHGIFEECRTEMLSILEAEISDSPDNFLESIKQQVQNLKIYSRNEMLDGYKPKRQIITSDHIAVNQGTKAPPHMEISVELVEINDSIALLYQLSKLAKQAGSHLSRKQKKNKKAEMIGTNVFIGHGSSSIWRELKDFIEDRVKLPYDEFNRVPVAGTPNIVRLSEMLDAAAIAFIILTGEDVQRDGSLHARLNAVHEAGLFQGRLGFKRAIILLEEDCEDFSNIEGLGQIRFPKGNIGATFEEIRGVLEREGIIEAPVNTKPT